MVDHVDVWDALHADVPRQAGNDDKVEISQLHLFGNYTQHASNYGMYTNIVAAFRGMHVSPAKHSYA